MYNRTYTVWYIDRPDAIIDHPDIRRHPFTIKLGVESGGVLFLPRGGTARIGIGVTLLSLTWVLLYLLRARFTTVRLWYHRYTHRPCSIACSRTRTPCAICVALTIILTRRRLARRSAVLGRGGRRPSPWLLTPTSVACTIYLGRLDAIDDGTCLRFCEYRALGAIIPLPLLDRTGSPPVRIRRTTFSGRPFGPTTHLAVNVAIHFVSDPWTRCTAVRRGHVTNTSPGGATCRWVAISVRIGRAQNTVTA